MAHESPNGRRGHNNVQSSPERGFLSGFLNDSRNTELSHRDALVAAQAEHDRVREAAIRVYELHELQTEHRRLQQEKLKEQERLRIEAELVAEEQRLRALKAQKIPKLPPEPPSPKAPLKQQISPTVNKDGSATAQSVLKAGGPISTPSIQSNLASSSTASQGLVPAQPLGTTTQHTTTSAATITPTLAAQTPAPPSFLQPKTAPLSSGAPQIQQSNGLIPSALSQAPPQQPTPIGLGLQSQPVPAKPVTSDAYLQIHQALKKLRKDLETQSRAPGSPLKGKIGEMRREIRKSMGQLTGGKGANAQPVSLILIIISLSLLAVG
jgi:nucleoporin GLE1